MNVMENKNTEFSKIFRNSVIQKTSAEFTRAILDVIRRNPVYKMEYSVEMSYSRWWQYVFAILSTFSILVILYLLFYTNLLSTVMASDFFLSEILDKVRTFLAGFRHSIHLSTLSVVLLLCIPFFLLIEQTIRYFSFRKQA